MSHRLRRRFQSKGRAEGVFSSEIAPRAASPNLFGTRGLPACRGRGDSGCCPPQCAGRPGATTSNSDSVLSPLPTTAGRPCCVTPCAVASCLAAQHDEADRSPVACALCREGRPPFLLAAVPAALRRVPPDTQPAAIRGHRLHAPRCACRWRLFGPRGSAVLCPSPCYPHTPCASLSPRIQTSTHSPPPATPRVCLQTPW